ncbi:MAG: cytochrome c [Myxococcales bacterium]|jgi:mono/diheme cytochrome c family protein
MTMPVRNIQRAPFLLVALAALLGSVGCRAGGAQAEDAPSGEKVFEEHKCARCHKPGGKRDLAGVGKKHKPEALADYLRGKTEIDGRKHKPKFDGTDAELQALVKWLAGRK